VKESYRKTRRAKCMEYLKRAGTLPEAVALAKSEGFSQNTSVWLGALSDLLMAQSKDEDNPSRG
jgi:hypothetical protein